MGQPESGQSGSGQPACCRPACSRPERCQPVCCRCRPAQDSRPSCRPCPARCPFPGPAGPAVVCRTSPVCCPGHADPCQHAHADTRRAHACHQAAGVQGQTAGVPCRRTARALAQAPGRPCSEVQPSAQKCETTHVFGQTDRQIGAARALQRPEPPAAPKAPPAASCCSTPVRLSGCQPRRIRTRPNQTESYRNRPNEAGPDRIRPWQAVSDRVRHYQTVSGPAGPSLQHRFSCHHVSPAFPSSLLLPLGPRAESVRALLARASLSHFLFSQRFVCCCTFAGIAFRVVILRCPQLRPARRSPRRQQHCRQHRCAACSPGCRAALRIMPHARAL